MPRVVANGRAIYRGKITRREADNRIEHVWRPWHDAIDQLLRDSLVMFGEAILVDCHSMPHEAIESIGHPQGRRPDIVLGDRFGAAASSDVVDRIEAAFERAGLRVARNAPFAGAYVTQDSYTGPNQSLPYDEVSEHWKVFNRVYVVIVDVGREQELRSLLGDQGPEQEQARRALQLALTEIEADREDRYAWFNAGTNYVGLGRLEEAAEAYDRARVLKLPYRLLWYQFGPFEAYLGTSRYQDVIDLANANLRAADNLEESYYYRALARRALGDRDGAREDLERALRLNPLFDRAAEALKE